MVFFSFKILFSVLLLDSEQCDPVSKNTETAVRDGHQS